MAWYICSLGKKITYPIFGFRSIIVSLICSFTSLDFIASYPFASKRIPILHYSHNFIIYTHYGGTGIIKHEISQRGLCDGPRWIEPSLGGLVGLFVLVVGMLVVCRVEIVANQTTNQRAIAASTIDCRNFNNILSHDSVSNQLFVPICHLGHAGTDSCGWNLVFQTAPNTNREFITVTAIHK